MANGHVCRLICQHAANLLLRLAQAQQYPRLSRQISTLDKLVEATVSAMAAGSSSDQ